MRFTIAVDAAWQATITGGDDSGWHRKRAMRRLDLPSGASVPLPPPGDLPPDTEIHHPLCAGDAVSVSELLDRIAGRRPRATDVEALGRYLFHTLIGPEIWADLRARAGAADLVELGLEFDPADGDLNRMHWEVMHAPEGFLARGAWRPVAVTRVVPTSKPVVTGNHPPRVLFLVGSDVTDPQVRAGAEFFGLLRRVSADGRGFHSRVVQKADATVAAKAVESFQPDVIHVIGHGSFDSTGRPFLEFQRERGDNDPSGGRIFAKKLLDIVTAEGKRGPPAVVVVSACHSAGAFAGRSRAGSEAAPLAAELVAGGVPVVVGMAGRISDRACRHFTRRFGEALITGEPLLKAIERGRRAVFTDDTAPTSIDWGYPTIFVSDQVPADFVPCPQKAGVDMATVIANRIATYEPMREPVFCARHEFHEAYYRLMESSPRPVLAVYTREEDRKVGVSRLLDEILSQAVNDGHVPVLVRKRTPADHMAASGAAALAVHVLRGIAAARRAFQLPPPTDSRLLMLLRTIDPAAHDRIVADFTPISGEALIGQLLMHYGRAPDDRLGALDPHGVADTVRIDLRELGSAARAAQPDVDRAGGRTLVLFDDVQEYDAGIDALLNRFLGGHGLGTADYHVPVVFGFRLGTAADAVLQSLTLHDQPKPWLEARQLRPFRNDGEDLLAYARVLLHPFHPQIMPGVSDVPLAINDDADPVIRNTMEQMFREIIKGRPTSFFQDLFYATAKVSVANCYLVEADDERLLRERFGGGGQ